MNETLGANLSGIFLPSGRCPLLKDWPSLLLLKIQVLLVTLKKRKSPLRPAHTATDYAGFFQFGPKAEIWLKASILPANSLQLIQGLNCIYINYHSNIFNQEEIWRHPVCSLPVSMKKVSQIKGIISISLTSSIFKR